MASQPYADPYTNNNEPRIPTEEEMKRSDRAVVAFENRDTDASRREHDKIIAHGKEKHSGAASDYVKSIVFGALDGIVTTFAVVSAAMGAGNAFGNRSHVVLIMGFANLFADGFSMGFGEYISSSAEADHIRSERMREEWEVDSYIEGEKREMVELYMSKGLCQEDSQTIVDIISKDKKVFVDIMMVEELGLLAEDTSDPWGPHKQGLVIYLSFLLFGSIPLLAYTSGRADDTIFGIACGLTGFSLFCLGMLKGKLTAQNVFRTGFIMLINGSIAAALSYAISVFVSEVFGLKE
jgi:VIT1/CCC1 family predicted Fe2+/Mn2+ transporter